MKTRRDSSSCNLHGSDVFCWWGGSTCCWEG